VNTNSLGSLTIDAGRRWRLNVAVTTSGTLTINGN
jgi:hypothetical protein